APGPHRRGLRGRDPLGHRARPSRLPDRADARRAGPAGPRLPDAALIPDNQDSAPFRRGSVSLAEAQKVAIRSRAVTGKKVARLRRAGVLPGVVFGGHKDSTPVETDMKEFERGYRRWGTTTLLTLTGLDGDQPALIHDVSRSTLTGKLLHVDFQRVSLTEKVHAEVPLHFVGESPAEKAGAVLVHAKREVNVEAFPKAIHPNI